jgi:hypothetical protein
MGEQSRLVPAQEQFLTADELEDEDSELVFVQHAAEVDRERLAVDVGRYFAGKRQKCFCLTEIEPQNAVYPVGFDGNGLRVSRPLTRYLFAAPI